MYENAFSQSGFRIFKSSISLQRALKKLNFLNFDTTLKKLKVD